MRKITTENYRNCRGKKERTARIVGANYTDEARLMHTQTLISVSNSPCTAATAQFKKLLSPLVGFWSE
jgi:hypothetical protein